jgi:hypothetical protein
VGCLSDALGDSMQVMTCSLNRCGGTWQSNCPVAIANKGQIPQKRGRFRKFHGCGRKMTRLVGPKRWVRNERNADRFRYYNAGWQGGPASWCSFLAEHRRIFCSGEVADYARAQFFRGRTTGAFDGASEGAR